MVSSGMEAYHTVDRLGVRRAYDPYSGTQPGLVDTSYSSAGTHALVARKIDFDEFSNGSRQKMHIRQNFGTKGQIGGYIPPVTHQGTDHGIGAAQQTAQHEGNNRGDDEYSTGSEMPFDMKAESSKATDSQISTRIPPDGMTSASILSEEQPVHQAQHDTSFETIWETTPDRELHSVNIQSRRQHGDFRLPPPRLSDPSPLRNTVLTIPGVSVRRPGEGSFYREVNVQPGQVDGSEYSENRHQLMAELDVIPSHERGSEGDDSIFDFKEEVKMEYPEMGGRPVKTTNKMRRKPIMRIDNDMEPDDTSLEHYGPSSRKSPTNLHERAQEAWRYRQKKNSALRSKRDLQWPRKQNSVSFQGQDTVQYFDPEEENDSDGKNDSLEERSLNSEYTKTLESEVEDMIKDMFFIGSGTSSRPGRRKYKYKHEVKTRLRNGEIQASEKSRIYTSKKAQTTESDMVLEEFQSETNETTGDQSKEIISNSEETQTSMARSEVLSTGPSLSEQAENSIWGIMEGGMTAMSEALGLTPEPGADTASRGRTLPDADLLPFDACTGGMRATKSVSTQGGFLEYAHDLLANIEDSNDVSSASHSKDSTEGQNSLTKLHKGQDMTPLALHAAKSLHQSQGVDFDDSYQINFTTDLKLSSAELKLPLGLIFLENDGGCFVTKISPDGSAARSGAVEVGDQLAAINGTSALKMTVDDICNTIKKSGTPQSVKLVFLRYTGPFLPLRKSITQEPSFELEALGSPQSSFEEPPGGTPVVSESTNANAKSKGNKKKFRLFGRMKKKATKSI